MRPAKGRQDAGKGVAGALQVAGAPFQVRGDGQTHAPASLRQTRDAGSGRPVLVSVR